ncbi:alpha/beta hydrolase family protein [Kitasatospora sp. NBC_00240]|uniref:alpha/beta hydrolase n=1 Tax=Kitasatospora sp. NBC_00240 TaxID=2903567 RepID=UPI002251FE27|nr:alpha/beta hydrolase [Kitasatospora sp. NBC_00240]MCX5213059.1 alpha/beta hydrolase family protein [Kitasatospora sp. NBC_00240]
MSNIYELLLKFDPNAIHDAAKGWRTMSRAVEDAYSRHRHTVNGPLRHAQWTGKDADSAFYAMEFNESVLETLRVEAEAAALALDTTADRMYQAQTNLTNAMHRATEWQLTISGDGTVNLPPPSPGEQHDPDAQDARRNLAGLRTEAQERINAALKAAQEASDQGKRALGRLSPLIFTTIRTGGEVAESARDAADVIKELGLVDPSLPDGKDPAKSAEWWKSLTADQQKSYLALHPEEIGRLDGLPSAVRDEANRLFLEQQNDALHVGKAQDFGITQNEFNARGNAVRELKERLDAADGDADGRELLLLGIDPKGDGRAIVAMGNPDTADHTAVLVPGTATTLASVPGQIERIGALQQAASSEAPGQRVSTIFWLGYDAPEVPPSNLSVVGTGRAEEAAESMRRFTEGTRVAQGDHRTHLTVIGHSYGTTAVGAAASTGGGLQADDIVAIASPGMTTGSAANLNIDPAHVWVGAADDDAIRDVAGFSLGFDPMFSEFGGNNIKIDTHGHSGYWDQASASLLNQGKIIAGRPPATVDKEAQVDPETVYPGGL